MGMSLTQAFTVTWWSQMLIAETLYVFHCMMIYFSKEILFIDVLVYQNNNLFLHFLFL